MKHYSFKTLFPNLETSSICISIRVVGSKDNDTNSALDNGRLLCCSSQIPSNAINVSLTQMCKKWLLPHKFPKFTYTSFNKIHWQDIATQTLSNVPYLCSLSQNMRKSMVHRSCQINPKLTLTQTLSNAPYLCSLKGTTIWYSVVGENWDFLFKSICPYVLPSQINHTLDMLWNLMQCHSKQNNCMIWSTDWKVSVPKNIKCP